LHFPRDGCSPASAPLPRCSLCARFRRGAARISVAADRVLIPQPPGGANDNIARVIGPPLGDALGQPLIVENRPGRERQPWRWRSSQGAARWYTLLLGADAQIVVNPHFLLAAVVRTMRDLAPVASW